MKKLSLIIYTLCCVMMTSLSSCVRDVMDEPTLSISHQGDLLIPSEGKEVTLPILTNQPNWQSISNADWLTLTAAGNNLIIDVAPNTAITERSAQIVIVAGSRSLNLTVLQSQETVRTIELDPLTLNARRDAGEYRVSVRSNTDLWTVEKPEEAEWVQIFSRPTYGEIVITLKENKGNAARFCQLTLRNGMTTKKFEIRQEGYPHFFLPYMNWGSKLSDAETFEESRQSRMTSRPRQGNPLTGIREIPDFGFSTISSAFQQVRYEYLNLGTSFLYKSTLIAEDKSVLMSEDFKKFLSAEGYILRDDVTSTDEVSYYHNLSKKIHLQVSIPADTKEAYLIFTPIVEQDKAYEMPQILPMGYPITASSTKREVEAWESANKGELSKAISEALGQPFYFAPKPYYSRQYLFDPVTQDKVNAVIFALDPDYRGMYKYGGLAFVTRELNALIKAAGFTYHSHDVRRGIYYYQNKNKGLRLSINIMGIGNMELTRCQITLLPPTA